MSPLLLFVVAALVTAGVLLYRARAVYGEVREAFRRTGRDLDLAYRESPLGMPSLLGMRRGKALTVELAGRPWSPPDSIRVVWNGRPHLRAGLTLTPELVDELVTLLAEAERRAAERAGGTMVRLQEEEHEEPR